MLQCDPLAGSRQPAAGSRQPTVWPVRAGRVSWTSVLEVLLEVLLMPQQERLKQQLILLVDLSVLPQKRLNGLIE